MARCKYCCLVVFIVFLIGKTYSQTPTLDSIQVLIDNAQNDTLRLRYKISYAAELAYVNPSNSKKNLDEAIHEAQLLKFRQGEADALYSKAIAEAFEGNYQESMTLMINATSIYQEIGKESGVAKCYGGIGNIYYFLNNFPKAVEYYENALKIYEKNNEETGIASCLGNLGLIFQETYQFDKALKYQYKGLELEKKKDNKRGIAISYISISSIFLSMDNLSEAKKNAKEAIRVSAALMDSSTLSDGYLRLAECYRKLGVMDSAQIYLNKTIDINYKIKAYHQLAYALETQTNLYDSIGKYSLALKAHRDLLRIKDTLLNSEKTSQIIELQTKFDTEKKEKENQLLTEQNRRQEITLYSLAILVILGTGLALNIYNSRRKIRNANLTLISLNSELQQQKEEVLTQAENLQQANYAIQNQKELIEFNHRKITDSIAYASIIQSAMLPSEDIIGNYFSDYFVFYKPRDVVSGDFYWIKEKDDSVIIAVADCTGHGVPGSLLSIMGISYLNEIIGTNNLTQPDKVLDELRLAVKSIFKQSPNDLRKEGIEIAMISYNPKTQKLIYSGAKISLWICRNGKIQEFPADKMSIGLSMKESAFKLTEVSLEKNDIIYLFTDGISDQLSYETGKKYLRKNYIEFLTRISYLPLSNQKISINEMLQNWKGKNCDQTDDILVLGLKV